MIQNSLKIFFWRIAGSNIEILKKCETEHSKHVQIGLMIFTTTVFAGFAGGLAGYEIGGQKFSSAIGFGLLWAFLIFSIDRTMVVSLSKNENKRLVHYIIATLIRVILAAIISFVISIPLEIQVFSEVISVQMKKKNIEEVKIYKENIAEIKNRAEIEGSLSQAQEQLKYRESQMNMPCQTAKCNSLSSSIKNLENELKTAKQNLTTQKGKTGKAWNEWDKVPLKYKYDDDGRIVKTYRDKSSPKWRDYLREKRKQNTLEKQVTQRQNELDDEKDNHKQAIFNYKIQQEQLRDQAIQDINDNRNKLEEVDSTISLNSDSLKNDLSDKKGFLRKYKAMTESIKDEPHLNFFLWLIRFLFFVIEILPTASKMLTPAGKYEELLKIQGDDLTKKFEKEINNSTILLEDQHEKESRLNQQILDSIAEAQSELAKEMINYWKKEQLSNLKKTKKSSSEDKE